jgi:peptide/nickel transport system ATP-binding protein
MNASATRQPILDVSGLTVEFWVDGDWIPAAIDLEYTVAPGEVLAIVGESGSGKSTSSMALLGLLPENARISGSVKLMGEEILGAKPDRLREIRGGKIAVIFQEPMTALNPAYTVGFQIVETLQTHDPALTKAAARTQAVTLLEMVEMPDPTKAFNSYPHQLSGGQRQRAMIAQAISCDPVLLIADEPTTALDVTVQAEILDLLRDLHRRLDSSIVLITHDMGVVADLADHVMVMKDGRTVETGTSTQVFKTPQMPYTKLLLESVPRLDIPAARPDSARTEMVLSLNNVSVDYPKRGRVPAFRAVENATLEIGKGEILGLVGESGSGKTTVGRAVVGLLPVAEGALTVDGQPMAGLSAKELRAVRRNIGIVFQDPGSSLNPRWPVGQSIAEPLELSGEFDRVTQEKRVTELLDQVELPHSYRNRYPHELSGGQRQRIGIARALALRPKLLVADEPTSALDVSVQARVLDLLQAIQKELQFACLFVSHDLAVIDLLADRIAVMHRGKIVEQGLANQILRSPREAYTKQLIDAVPIPDPEEQRKRRESRRMH